MKPNLALDQHVTVNSKLALQLRIPALLIVITIGLIWIFAQREASQSHHEAEEYVKVASNLMRESFNDITQGRSLDTLNSTELNQLHLKTSYLSSHLDCKFYVINQQQQLLFADATGGPFGVAVGQKLYDLSEVSKAVNTALQAPQSASYEGQQGQHLIYALPLSSPNAYIVADTNIPAWYSSLGHSLYFAIAIGIVGILIARRWIRRSIKDWRRQNLSQTIMDTLTGFPNRRGMELFIQQSFAAPQKALCANSLMLISLDHFSQINIHFGNEAGDTVLKQISSRIRSWLHPNDLIGRWSGDTFVVLHKGSSDYNAIALADKIMTEINKINFDIAGETVRVNVSIGVHTVDSQGSLRLSIAQVEQALSKAKQVDGHHIVHSSHLS